MFVDAEVKNINKWQGYSSNYWYRVLYRDRVLPVCHSMMRSGTIFFKLCTFCHGTMRSGTIVPVVSLFPRDDEDDNNSS